MKKILFLITICLSVIGCKQYDQLLSGEISGQRLHITVTSDTLAKLTNSQIQKLPKPSVNAKRNDKVLATRETYGFKVNRTNNTHYCEAYFTDPYSVYVEWELWKDGQLVAYLPATNGPYISFNIENPNYGNYVVRFRNTYYNYTFQRYETSPLSSTGTQNLPFVSIFFRNDNDGSIYTYFEGRLRGVPNMQVLNSVFNYNEYYVTHYTTSNMVLPSIGTPYASNSKLIKTSNSATIYLLENSTIRPISSPGAAQSYGIDISRHVTVSSISGYNMGATIY